MPEDLRQQLKRRLERTEILFAGIVLVVVGASFCYSLNPVGVDWVLFLSGPLIFYIFLYLGIIVHELGHVLMGWLCGMSLHRVRIGSGSKTKSFQFCGLTWTFGAVSAGGWVEASNRKHQWFRLRTCLFLLGGPAFSGIFLWGSIRLANSPRLPENVFSLWLTLMAISQGWLFIYNLWPRYVRLYGTRLPSDGLGLWQTLVRSRVQHDVELGGILMSANEPKQARECLLRALHSPRLSTEQRSVVLDTLACLPLYCEGQPFLKEAVEWIKEARRISPNTVTYQGTCGGILMELERTEEAIPFLQECYDKGPGAHDKAISACYLALAAARQNNQPESDRLLALAQHHVQNCVVYSRIAREIDKLHRVQSRSDVP